MLLEPVVGEPGAGGAVVNKALLSAFLSGISSATNMAEHIARYCRAECAWRVFAPFDTQSDNQAVAAGFWPDLLRAMPDLELRSAFMIAGSYEGREMLSLLGTVMGTFDAPLAGIPPTHGLATLRIGINASVVDGRIDRMYILLDLIDLMRQAGVYPFRAMPGAAEAWAFPPCDSSATTRDVDAKAGARTLGIIHEMQMGLPRPDQVATLTEGRSLHSHHWHPHMNWYGPAGIGAMRGERGFRNFHGALFLQAFPDRTGFPRTPGGPVDAPGHYVRLGDGHYAVTGGWPSLTGTHRGPEWLGLPPTGRRIEMRVADWYRIDDEGRIADNWVMMDIPHIVQQMGMDIFHDLQFIADPARTRWPVPVVID